MVGMGVLVSGRPAGRDTPGHPEESGRCLRQPLHRIEHLPLRLLRELMHDQRSRTDDRDDQRLRADPTDLDLCISCHDVLPSVLSELFLGPRLPPGFAHVRDACRAPPGLAEPQLAVPAAPSHAEPFPDATGLPRQRRTSRALLVAHQPVTVDVLAEICFGDAGASSRPDVDARDRSRCDQPVDGGSRHPQSFTCFARCEERVSSCVTVPHDTESYAKTQLGTTLFATNPTLWDRAIVQLLGSMTRHATPWGA